VNSGCQSGGRDLARRFLLLGGNRLELDEPALGVETEIDHARVDRRRVGGRHDAGDQRIVVELRHHHPARARAVPELHERRPAGQDATPIGPSRLLRKVVLDLSRVQEAVGGVRRGGRVAEVVQDLPRLGRQDLGRRQAELVDPAQPDPQRQREQQSRDDHREVDERGTRSQAGRRSGIRHDLRRGRLPRGQGAGQRIAAGKRGRHRQHRSRTPGRIALEAAHDRALDRRIQVPHQVDGLWGLASVRVRMASASVLPSKAFLPVKIS
jgi:hypothetical protein